MKNNWPETIDELLEQCNRLIDAYDLYTLGEIGKPLPGETEPRVDGTEYLAGEYQYGVAMIPAQWVTHVMDNHTCELTKTTWDTGECTWGCICSNCNGRLEHETGHGINFCPKCGAKVINIKTQKQDSKK